MSAVLATKETIEQASQLLQGGGVVAFPTETVYGLGCDTLNKKAISLVYTLKSRPNNNPLIAHVCNIEDAKNITNGWDSRCDTLANAFWPGPLTIILHRNSSVPKEASGGSNTIAVRCPNHEVAKKLLARFGGPISAPSANISGHTSPTTAAHVRGDFGDELFILDGGPCEKGIESTVISMVGTPTILRLGSITTDDITKLIGEVVIQNSTHQNESPGTSEKHYAPKSRLILQTTDEIQNHQKEKTVFLVIGATPTIGTAVQMPDEPVAYAKYMYAEIRKADAMNPERICVEKPPNTPDWDAVNDRLRRASS
ncbi:MAG: threonylcarbamoyl-AMP synthase [Planctomycetes bacterium]|nr:threonylcarbamoyl-AMP synthase [Planctomycetota bacterium]